MLIIELMFNQFEVRGEKEKTGSVDVQVISRRDNRIGVLVNELEGVY